VLQVSHHVPQRRVSELDRMYQARNISFKIEQASRGQIVLNHLAHEMNLVQRGENFIVNPSRESQTLVPSLVRNSIRHDGQGTLLLGNCSIGVA
jgi:hypothetical protein